MKIIKLTALVLGLFMFNNVIAQKGRDKAMAGVRNPGEESTDFSFSIAAGTASYMGDLIQGNRLFNKPGIAITAGVIYPIMNKLNARLDLGVQKIQAADSKNKDAQYKARNLSFKSTVIDISASAEYTILNMERFGFSPYISAGIGIMNFTSSAEDVNGRKYLLRDLNTEGQGLAGYADVYNKSSIIIPLGMGIKYPVNDRVTLQLDFTYRITGTDYLDDVSANSYPDKAVLDARNPITSSFTWRGNEVGSGPYPKGGTLPRGNPKDNDGYYTTQFKVAFKL